MEVRREIVVDAPPDEVWEALTEAEELEEWLADEVELDVRPGGAGRFRWHDGSERHAVVEDVEIERLLEFWWWSDDDDASLVSVRLDEVAEGTRVTVTETPPAVWASALETRFAAGVLVGA